MEITLKKDLENMMSYEEIYKKYNGLENKEIVISREDFMYLLEDISSSEEIDRYKIFDDLFTSLSSFIFNQTNMQSLGDYSKAWTCVNIIQSLYEYYNINLTRSNERIKRAIETICMWIEDLGDFKYIFESMDSLDKLKDFDIYNFCSKYAYTNGNKQYFNII